MSRDREETTALLLAWSRGDVAARDRLIDRVYPELRRLAVVRLNAVAGDISLSPTEVANEAYLALVDQRRTEWRNRSHFFAISARLIRRILLNHLRDKRRLKRGGGRVAVALPDLAIASGVSRVDLIALEEALEKLGRIDARAEQVVELRYFGGRDWRAARLWLKELLA